MKKAKKSDAADKPPVEEMTTLQCVSFSNGLSGEHVVATTLLICGLAGAVGLMFTWGAGLVLLTVTSPLIIVTIVLWQNPSPLGEPSIAISPYPIQPGQRLRGEFTIPVRRHIHVNKVMVSLIKKQFTREGVEDVDRMVWQDAYRLEKVVQVNKSIKPADCVMGTFTFDVPDELSTGEFVGKSSNTRSGDLKWFLELHADVPDSPQGVGGVAFELAISEGTWWQKTKTEVT